MRDASREVPTRGNSERMSPIHIYPEAFFRLRDQTKTEGLLEAVGP